MAYLDPDAGGANEAKKAATVAAIATADAPAQTGAYVQADVEAIRTLANATKAKMNDVITALKNAGLMKT